MKLKDLNEKFPVIKKVYDNGVTDFQRRVDLIESYNELKQWSDFIDQERERLRREYADTKTGQINERFLPKVGELFQEALEADISDKIKKVLKFTVEEVKEAELTGTELALVYDDFVLKNPSPKNKKQ